MRAHVVSGWGAGGSLQQACRQHGLIGHVFAIEDDLEVGPLTTDEHRCLWWKPLEDQYLERLSSKRQGLHEQWRSAAEEILDRASEVVIWSSDSGRDQIHLRLAAAKLEAFTGSVRLVHVPADDGTTGVWRFWPKTLAECERTMTTLSPEGLKALAHDFRENWDNSDGVRLQTDVGLRLFDYSVFDNAILNNCSDEFENPAKVIGYTLSELDGRNWVPDIFLRWRLRVLVNAGFVQAIGTRWFVDDCDIRVRSNIYRFS